MAFGELNDELSPMPSSEPSFPVPAMVVTLADESIFLIKLFR